MSMILVTGGAGFIGANLLRLLVQEGYKLRVLDDFSVGGREYLQDVDVEIVEGDVRDARAVRRALDGVYGVVHLAAQTGVPGSLADPLRDCNVNVLGTLNLLEGCRHAEVERFVFASSNAPLGSQEPPASEDKAPLPISPYGASKLAGEGYCLAYCGSWGLATTVLRFANVYGPYSAHKQSVVARFFQDILTQGRIVIEGDGQQTRDFLYVGDLCRAIVLALESESAGEVYQIATGVETSISALAEFIGTVTHQASEIDRVAARPGDIRKNYSDVSKARAGLRWEPTTELSAGLRATWQWFQAAL